MVDNGRVHQAVACVQMVRERVLITERIYLLKLFGHRCRFLSDETASRRDLSKNQEVKDRIDYRI